MNVDNIKRVRDHIAGLPDTLLDMAFFSMETSCGTSHCIAGWARCLLAPRSRRTDSAVAQDLLGLSSDEAHDLFYCGGADDNDPAWLSKPSQAVAVLDHLIATGEVDWSVARSAEGSPEAAQVES